MANTASTVSRPFRLFTGVVLAAGAVAFVASWRIAPPVPSVQFFLLLAAVIVSENFAFSLPTFSISMSYPMTMAAVVVAGPAAAGILAAASSTNLQEIKSHRPASVYACNLGQLLAVTSLGSWVYLALGGRILLSSSGSLPLVASDFPRILMPFIATAITCAAGNVVLAALAASLFRGRSIGDLIEALTPFAPSQVALAFVGFLIGQVLAVNVLALPLFVVPLLVARQLYLRYTTMRTAFADTVKSLIGALEAKDHYTRGHSERVAKYSLQLGEALNLDQRSLERLEYAALLHDLGKLSLPASILRKPEGLTDEERRQVLEHPDAGADMVTRIPPLHDLADPVRHHHERYAGGAYPSGVCASETSSFGRILCVADSFDAMTTTRAYRPAMSLTAAIAELEAGAGTQFDPQMVNAFIEVFGRSRDAEEANASQPVEPLESMAVGT